MMKDCETSKYVAHRQKEIHSIPTDLMVMLIESHLNIKANELRQVPMCVTVLSTENFKYK